SIMNSGSDGSAYSTLNTAAVGWYSQRQRTHASPSGSASASPATTGTSDISRWSPSRSLMLPARPVSQLRAIHSQSEGGPSPMHGLRQRLVERLPGGHAHDLVLLVHRHGVARWRQQRGVERGAHGVAAEAERSRRFQRLGPAARHPAH